MAARVFRAKTVTSCVYCPNLIRPGQAISPDHDARTFVHAGCFQRVNYAIIRANT